MTTEDLACVLLMGLSDRTQRDTYASVALTEFADDDVRVEQVEEAARLLEKRGHVSVLETLGWIGASVTFEGLREADRITAERANHGARLSHALDQLVEQAFAAPDATVRLQTFVATTLFLGEHLGVAVVLRAARYLHDHGLAVLTPAAGQPETLTLTSAGEDCALSGTKVRKYVSDQNTPVAGPTFTQIVHGGTAAQGYHVTQNVGVQPDQLADLVRELRGLVQQVPEQAREEFLEDVEVLEDTEQDPQVRSRAGHRIMTALNAAPGVQAVVETLGQVIGALSG
ncbi:hypothetical protein CIB93_04495 [Streptomyces sp. WZ.A104]|uniref:hypothetical protein n=1 Tax=Streptomyces sp. WZ.A104 TaxID=2023771 RepID=UPI000BBB8557|nr:hypothetical protein [Streptomyces sp. WZ.A104]PCG87112.1 hypothetical protein CIB93_04495 [Streptomyces sp. WZ.A104]